MRSCVAAGAFLLAGVSGAVAGGGDRYAMPAQWTGFYVGAHAGYAWGDWDVDLVHPFPAVPGGVLSDGGSIGSNGWLGGFQIGANYQTGSLVLGVETDISWTGLDDDKSFRMDIDTDWATSLDLQLFGTARARVGLVKDNWLFYVTGGLAWGRGEMNIDTISITGPVTMSQLTAKANHIGWTAGLGAEWAATENISVKAEWLYVDLGSADYDPKGLAYAGTPQQFNHHELASASLDFHTARIGINYRFGDYRAPLK